MKHDSILGRYCTVRRVLLLLAFVGSFAVLGIWYGDEDRPGEHLQRPLASVVDLSGSDSAKQHPTKTWEPDRELNEEQFFSTLDSEAGAAALLRCRISNLVVVDTPDAPARKPIHKKIATVVLEKPSAEEIERFESKIRDSKYSAEAKQKMLERLKERHFGYKNRYRIIRYSYEITFAGTVTFSPSVYIEDTEAVLEDSNQALVAGNSSAAHSISDTDPDFSYFSVLTLSVNKTEEPADNNSKVPPLR